MNVSITDESVTTQTWWFAWLIPFSPTELLIPLSVTKHDPETFCPSRILTLYFIKFILKLSSHQPSPYRHFKSPFPDTVALRSVKQPCELHLSNDCKEAGILSVIYCPVVVIW